MSKGRIWLLALIGASLLELLIIGFHQVTAQATATAAASATGTATPAPQPTATPAPAGATSYAAYISSLEEAPSGYTTDAVKVYYDWMYAHYLARHDRLETGINWSGPFWIAFFGGMMILFFFLYALLFQNVHREHGELYGVMSFAGAIIERIGRVAFFSKVVWTGVVLATLYYIVTHILNGQVY